MPSKMLSPTTEGSSYRKLEVPRICRLLCLENFLGILKSDESVTIYLILSPQVGPLNDIDKILDSEMRPTVADESDASKLGSNQIYVKQYLVKWKGLSYLHCTWSVFMMIFLDDIVTCGFPFPWLVLLVVLQVLFCFSVGAVWIKILNRSRYPFLTLITTRTKN